MGGTGGAVRDAGAGHNFGRVQRADGCGGGGGGGGAVESHPQHRPHPGTAAAGVLLRSLQHHRWDALADPGIETWQTLTKTSKKTLKTPKKTL